MLSSFTLVAAAAKTLRFVTDRAIDLLGFDIETMLELVARRMNLVRGVALVATVAIRCLVTFLAVGSREASLVSVPALIQPLIVVGCGLNSRKIDMTRRALPGSFPVIVTRHTRRHGREI